MLYLVSWMEIPVEIGVRPHYRTSFKIYSLGNKSICFLHFLHCSCRGERKCCAKGDFFLPNDAPVAPVFNININVMVYLSHVSLRAHEGGLP